MEQNKRASSEQLLFAINYPSPANLSMQKLYGFFSPLFWTKKKSFTSMAEQPCDHQNTLTTGLFVWCTLFFVMLPRRPMGFMKRLRGSSAAGLKLWNKTSCKQKSLKYPLMRIKGICKTKLVANGVIINDITILKSQRTIKPRWWLHGMIFIAVCKS